MLLLFLVAAGVGGWLWWRRSTEQSVASTAGSATPAPADAPVTASKTASAPKSESVPEPSEDPVATKTTAAKKTTKKADAAEADPGHEPAAQDTGDQPD